MAGDWIKMRCNLWDDPRVTRLCDLTDSGEATIIGALYWLWSMADQHTEDGRLPGMTLRQIDRKTGVAGFGAALVDVGWLSADDAGVEIQGFEDHNGASAKKRCQTAQRVARSRNAQETHQEEACNAPSVTGALAREEKRREEQTNLLPTVEGSGSPLRAAPPAPPFDGENAEALNGKSVVALAGHWALPEQWGLDAEALGWKPVEVEREAEKFRQYWTAGRGNGTRRSVKGWRQSWSTWLEKAARDRR